MMDNNTKTKAGRGNPPAHGRFRKGQSGNPKGRPLQKAQPSLRELIEYELHRQVWAVVDGQRIRATKAHLITTRLAREAAKGKTDSIRLLQRIAIQDAAHKEAPGFEIIVFKSPAEQ